MFKTTKEATDKGYMLSSAFGIFIGRTKQQINNYKKKGMPSVKIGKNYYGYGFEAIQWLYDNEILKIEHQEEKEKKSLTPLQRKTLAEAKLKELDLDVRQKKFISSDVASRNGAEAGLFVRDILSSMPDRFIPRLELDEEAKHYLRVELKEEIYETLMGISNFTKGRK